jgi:hypothetical protein
MNAQKSLSNKDGTTKRILIDGKLYITKADVEATPNDSPKRYTR